MTEENIDIIIFLKDGKTLRFEKVENFNEDEEGWIGFVYQGISTGRERVAIFYLNNIAGYAIDPKGVEKEETDKEFEKKFYELKSKICANGKNYSVIDAVIYALAKQDVDFEDLKNYIKTY